MTKTIQGLWIGRELSLMEQLSIKSFIKNGHSFQLYVYEDVKNVPKETTLLDANSILPEEQIFRLNRGSHAGSLTAFSDLFRFKLLLEKGGWWVDLDIVCLKPFDFNSPYVITSEYNSPNGPSGPSNAVFKVPKDDEFIEACFTEAMSLCLNPKDLRFGENGFKLIREMVKKHRLESFVTPPETFAPISWWEYRTLVEHTNSFPDLSNSYAIHLYNEMWRTEMLNKNETYSEKTLYGALLRKYLL